MASCTTVIKVKRRRSQSPAEALLLHLGAKRPRASDKAEEASRNGHQKHEPPTKTVFQFVTTLTNADQDEKSIKKIVIDKATEVNQNASQGAIRKSNIKVHPSLVAKAQENLKASVEKSRTESRYKIVSMRRNMDENLFHLLDLVQEDEDSDHVTDAASSKPPSDDEVSCNGVKLEKESTGFVYDVYYPMKAKFNFQNDLSIEQVEKIDNQTAEEMYQLGMMDFVSYEGEEIEDPIEGDSDSNDEDNWRNDYPDDEDEYSKGYSDDDLDEKFGNLRVGFGDDDLSSDEDDELVFSKTFEKDAELHGTDYAKYKRRVLRENFYQEKTSSESEDYE